MNETEIRIQELLAEVKRLQDERKEISKQVLSLMNQVRHLRKRGEPKREITQAEIMFGKRLCEMSKAEVREYNRIKTQQSRERKKGGNNNGQ